jgi:hypothetical protein
MNNIGFVETNDAQKAEVVKSILSTIKNDVKEVSKMDNEVLEETVSESVSDEASEAVVEVEESVEKSVEDNEIEKADSEEVEKAEAPGATAAMEEEDEEMDDSEDDVEELTAKKSVDTNEEVSVHSEAVETTKAIAQEMNAAVNLLADTIKALNDKVEELNKSVLGVRHEVDQVKNEFGKRVDAVEKDTAFRKSGDLGEIVQEPIQKAQVQKSLWGGRFLSKSDLFA